MEHSIFGRLPPELRVMIYELALANSEPIVVDFQRFAPRPNNNLLALTATCKLIRAESAPIFYKKNEFVFLRAGQMWISKIGRQNAADIQNVTYEKSLAIDPAKRVERSADYRPFHVRLAPLVQFFRRTGACATLRLKVHLRSTTMIFSLSLEDLRAARRQVGQTCVQYVKSWNQSTLDGLMDNWTCLTLMYWSLAVLDEVRSILRQLEVEIRKRERERRGRKSKKGSPGREASSRERQ